MGLGLFVKRLTHAIGSTKTRSLVPRRANLPHPPTKPSNSGGNSSNSGQEKSKASNSSSSANSGSSKITSNQSSSGSRLDLTNKLGKDGKLTADECKMHLDNNLCMFCGGTSHFTDNCPKKTKKAKAHAVAITAESSKMDSNSGANSESKKE